jgi:hypothetical protein
MRENESATILDAHLATHVLPSVGRCHGRPQLAVAGRAGLHCAALGRGIDSPDNPTDVPARVEKGGNRFRVGPARRPPRGRVFANRMGVCDLKIR